MIEACTAAVNPVPTWVLMVAIVERIEHGNALDFIDPEVIDNLRRLLDSFKAPALVNSEEPEVQCVLCGRAGHRSADCPWGL